MRFIVDLKPKIYLYIYVNMIKDKRGRLTTKKGKKGKEEEDRKLE